MKKLTALIILLTLSVILLAGCGATAEPMSSPIQSVTANPENTADESALENTEGDLVGQHIGISMPNLSNEFLAFVAESMRAKLEENGMKVSLASADEQLPKQLEQLENFVSMGCDQIIVLPIAPDQVVDVLRKIHDGGVKIHILANEVKAPVFDTMVLANQYSIGEETVKMAAEWVEKTFPDAAPGSIQAGVLATVSSPESKTHCDAFAEISKYTDKVTIVTTAEIAYGEPASKAQEQVDNMFINYPDLKLIITYDGPQALAADEVVMRMPTVDKASFGVFGADWSEELGKRITLSETNEAVLRGTIKYGSDFAETALQCVTGTLPVDENKIFYVPMVAVTTRNVAELMAE